MHVPARQSGEQRDVGKDRLHLLRHRLRRVAGGGCGRSIGDQLAPVREEVLPMSLLGGVAASLPAPAVRSASLDLLPRGRGRRRAAPAPVRPARGRAPGRARAAPARALPAVTRLLGLGEAPGLALGGALLRGGLALLPSRGRLPLAPFWGSGDSASEVSAGGAFAVFRRGAVFGAGAASPASPVARPSCTTTPRSTSPATSGSSPRRCSVSRTRCSVAWVARPACVAISSAFRIARSSASRSPSSARRRSSRSPPPSCASRSVRPAAISAATTPGSSRASLFTTQAGFDGLRSVLTASASSRRPSLRSLRAVASRAAVNSSRSRPYRRSRSVAGGSPIG